MTIITITREMGSLGTDVARALVIRLLDGSAGPLERLTADRTSLSIFTADEIIGIAARGPGAVIRGWGATHLLREVPHAVPFQPAVDRFRALRSGAQYQAGHGRGMRSSPISPWPQACAPRCGAPRRRASEVAVSSESGCVMLSGAGSTDEMLAFVEVASTVPGVRDVAYRTHPGEELRPRFH